MRPERQLVGPGRSNDKLIAVPTAEAIAANHVKSHSYDASRRAEFNGAAYQVRKDPVCVVGVYRHHRVAVNHQVIRQGYLEAKSGALIDDVRFVPFPKAYDQFVNAYALDCERDAP